MLVSYVPAPVPVNQKSRTIGTVSSQIVRRSAAETWVRATRATMADGGIAASVNSTAPAAAVAIHDAMRARRGARRRTRSTMATAAAAASPNNPDRDSVATTATA